MGDRIDLISNGAATGAAQAWPGGRGSFAVSGSFGGATVALQLLGPDGATWSDVGADVSLTVAGVGNFELPPGDIRAAVAGGTPSGIYAIAVQVRR